MTKNDLKYVWYLLRHKYFVARAGLVLGVSWWRLLVHDFSKMRRDEWGPYRDYFYGKKDLKPDSLLGGFFDIAFRRAWKAHLKRNDHHWQYWLNPAGQPIEMPDMAVREMVADWIGTGRAIKGHYDFLVWWEKNEPIIVLTEKTRDVVIDLLLVFEAHLLDKGVECEWERGA